MKTFKQLRCELNEAGSAKKIAGTIVDKTVNTGVLPAYGSASYGNSVLDDPDRKKNKRDGEMDTLGKQAVASSYADSAANLASMVSKKASKMVPVTGALMGAAEAKDRWKKGDKVGAGLSAIGAAGSAAMPYTRGLSGLAQFGADAVNAYRDYVSGTGAYSSNKQKR